MNLSDNTTRRFAIEGNWFTPAYLYGGFQSCCPSVAGYHSRLKWFGPFFLFFFDKQHFELYISQKIVGNAEFLLGIQSCPRSRQSGVYICATTRCHTKIHQTQGLSFFGCIFRFLHDLMYTFCAWNAFATGHPGIEYRQFVQVHYLHVCLLVSNRIRLDFLTWWVDFAVLTLETGKVTRESKHFGSHVAVLIITHLPHMGFRNCHRVVADCGVSS